MTTSNVDKDTSIGFGAQKLRTSLGLTLEQVAYLAGVSPEKIRRFEEGVPVELGVKRKLLGTLWAYKMNQMVGS